METSLKNAKLWGCDSVLLVPAVVNPETSYQDAWTRSQKVVKERLLPLATELKVVIGMEEVWNKFLLSPLEMAKYVDEFASPYVMAYVDVGNMVFYGYPQDWIRTLGKRIHRVHLKDFKVQDEKLEWKNLLSAQSLPDLRDLGYQPALQLLNSIPVDLTAEHLKDICGRFKALVKERLRKEFR